MSSAKQTAPPYGQSIGTSAEQIGDDENPISMYSGVLLVSHPSNAADSVIYIGFSEDVNVSSDLADMGVPLTPGAGVDIPLVNLPNGYDTDLWAIGSASLILSIFPH